MQRARGALAVGFRLRDGETVLDRLHQSGCLKARFPRPERHAWRGVVTLNTSGGAAAGDALTTAIEAGPGAHATVAAQAAERFYRALPGSAPARLRTTLRVGPGAALEWLPQETILFDDCALDRETAIEVAADGWFLGVEMLVFGRLAMGETVRRARLSDRIVLRRDGRLLLHDAIRFQGEAEAALARAAVGGGARAVATLVHAAPDAEQSLGRVRQVLAGVEAGASAWDGLLVARLVAADGAALRRAVLAVLPVLRAERPLPRVWLC